MLGILNLASLLPATISTQVNSHDLLLNNKDYYATKFDELYKEGVSSKKENVQNIDPGDLVDGIEKIIEFINTYVDFGSGSSPTPSVLSHVDRPYAMGSGYTSDTLIKCSSYNAYSSCKI